MKSLDEQIEEFIAEKTKGYPNWKVETRKTANKSTALLINYKGRQFADWEMKILFGIKERFKFFDMFFINDGGQTGFKIQMTKAY